MNADAELTAFKTEIDLRQYAASKGYQLDPRESWRGSAVMRLGGRGGDKIIIKRNGNGHYVFFSVRDAGDNADLDGWPVGLSAHASPRCRLSRLRGKATATGVVPRLAPFVRISVAGLGVPVRDVSELLWHSDVRLTLTNYAHVLDENRTKMAGVIDGVFDTQTDTQAKGHG